MSLWYRSGSRSVSRVPGGEAASWESPMTAFKGTCKPARPQIQRVQTPSHFLPIFSLSLAQRTPAPLLSRSFLELVQFPIHESKLNSKLSRCLEQTGAAAGRCLELCILIKLTASQPGQKQQRWVETGWMFCQQCT